MRYRWMQAHQDVYPVAAMCRVLRAGPSGYYEWLGRPPSATQQRRERITEAVKTSHAASNGIYGYRKVHADLQAAGVACCAETVRRQMAANGLKSRRKRRFVATTDSRHTLPVAPNRLQRDFTAAGPNQKWLADITYVPTAEGWLYLAAVEDVFSRRIVGWAMGDRIDTNLVQTALKMAARQRLPEAGLLLHSDRGVQYASDAYQQNLRDLEIVCSMSRKGDCWDNAMMESFFGNLKTEGVDGKDYQTREEAKTDLFLYIEVFYNRQRRHAGLGYVSPADYEARPAPTPGQAA